MSSDESVPSISARPVTVAPVSLAVLAGHLGLSAAHLGLQTAGSGTAAVTGIALASGSVRPGDLYAALPGARHHGARFVGEAAERGAVAVLTDGLGAAYGEEAGLPTLVVEQPRRQLGELAAVIYGHPARSLTLIGVTGTQGKTTTTQLLTSGLQARGRSAAVIGTMGTWIDGHPVATALTTPEAPDLHALFAVMVERGVETCAMEVSSHALVMGRADGVVFDLAVFTNFGRDHLDFHADVDDYFAAKAQLFTAQRSRRALLNLDDPWVARLLTEPAIPTRTFSTTGADADWTAEIETARPDGSIFVVTGPNQLQFTATIALSGPFNVANALCALAAVGEVGEDVEAAALGLASLRSVRGRMERVDQGQPFTVLIDYAHKPDAVTAALEALRVVTKGKVIIVLGAGGDRDAGKRPVMGEIAARLADIVIVTDDNPRTEDPAGIRAELLAGARAALGSKADVLEMADRETAIRSALAAARAGDAVLIAGKGHELGQEVDGQVLPFDDREVALRALATMSDTGLASSDTRIQKLP